MSTVPEVIVVGWRYEVLGISGISNKANLMAARLRHEEVRSCKVLVPNIRLSLVSISALGLRLLCLIGAS